MLVLERKNQQATLIRTPVGNLKIKVLGIKGARVVLGFAGGPEFEIVRDDAKKATRNVA